MSDVAVKVKKIIVEHLGVDEAKVNEELQTCKRYY